MQIRSAFVLVPTVQPLSEIPTKLVVALTDRNRLLPLLRWFVMATLPPLLIRKSAVVLPPEIPPTTAKFAPGLLVATLNAPPEKSHSWKSTSWALSSSTAPAVQLTNRQLLQSARLNI